MTEEKIDNLKQANDLMDMLGRERVDLFNKPTEATIPLAQVAALIDIADSLRTLVKDGITGMGGWYCPCGEVFGSESWLNKHYDDSTGTTHEGPRPGSES